MPSRLQIDTCSVLVSGCKTDYDWQGGYIGLDAVAADATVQLTYPLPVQNTIEKVAGKEYQLYWKGDTVVDIRPAGTVCPLFNRMHFRQTMAPVKQTRLHVPAAILYW